MSLIFKAFPFSSPHGPGFPFLPLVEHPFFDIGQNGVNNFDLVRVFLFFFEETILSPEENLIVKIGMDVTSKLIMNILFRVTSIQRN